MPKVSRWLGCCFVWLFYRLSSIGGWDRTMARLSWQSIGAFVKCAERSIVLLLRTKIFFFLEHNASIATACQVGTTT